MTGIRFAIRIAIARFTANRAQKRAAARAARFSSPSSSGRPGTVQVIGPGPEEIRTSTSSARSSGTISETRSWYPSGRRAPTRRTRFTLAGASVASRTRTV